MFIALILTSPVSLDEAAGIGEKTKVVFNDGSKRHFKKIENIGNSYYGVLKQSDSNKAQGESANEMYYYGGLTGGMVPRVPLNENDIKSVRVLNRNATTWENTGIVLGSLLVIAGTAAAISMGNNSMCCDGLYLKQP